MKFFLMAVLAVSLLQVVARAENGKGEAIHLYVENDTHNIGGPGSDNAYSSGLKLSYIAAEDRVPAWADKAMEQSKTLRDALDGSKSNFGLSIGHQIYTPNDVRREDLIADDRPYAAWLYMGFSAHFQSSAQSHALEVDLGIIGPEAFGKQVQNNFHDFISTYRSEGWKNQLATEPTVQISYQQRLKFIEFKIRDQNYVDVIPFFGGGLGNVSVDLHAGGMIRAGNILDGDFGPARPSMTNGDTFVTPISDGIPKTSFYVFASAQGYAIAKNIFLDGNTFRRSHRVKKYPFVLETEFGAVGRYKQWSASWRFVSRSPEFEQRSVVNSFASISIGYAY